MNKTIKLTDEEKRLATVGLIGDVYENAGRVIALDEIKHGSQLPKEVVSALMRAISERMQAGYLKVYQTINK